VKKEKIIRISGQNHAKIKNLAVKYNRTMAQILNEYLVNVERIFKPKEKITMQINEKYDTVKKAFWQYKRKHLAQSKIEFFENWQGGQMQRFYEKYAAEFVLFKLEFQKARKERNKKLRMEQNKKYRQFKKGKGKNGEKIKSTDDRGQKKNVKSSKKIRS